MDGLFQHLCMGASLGPAGWREKIPVTWRHLYGHCAKETELVAVGYSQWLNLNGDLSHRQVAPVPVPPGEGSLHLEQQEV